MIMVSHDEYMRQYANRIFSVSDGKINKMAIVNEVDRENAISELRNTLREYELGNDTIGVKMAVKQKEEGK